MLYRHRDNCRLCHSHDVEIVVPLQPIPIKTPNLGDGGGQADTDTLQNTLVPVDLYRCNDCGMLQLLDIIDPEVQYNDFRYKTSISLGLPEHFVRLAQGLIKDYQLAKDAFVFEIGSNDGTLLKAFQNEGHRVLGIDPARTTAKEATDKGIPTIADFFTQDMAGQIAAEHGPADLIISNNTFANLDDLDDIVQGMKAVLSADGIIVIETQYGADVIQSMLIDTVYHEHLSYFLVAPLDKFFERLGLELIHVERIVTKGGSLRLVIQNQGGPRARQDSVDTMINDEARFGLDQAEVYKDFSQQLTQARKDLVARVEAVRTKGEKVAAYGASVGTVTLLHQLGISTSLDFIVDDKPIADSVEGPNYSIPITTPERLYEDRPELVVVLAVRYHEPIRAKHTRFVAEGGVFAVPLPELKIFGAEGNG